MEQKQQSSFSFKNQANYHIEKLQLISDILQLTSGVDIVSLTIYTLNKYYRNNELNESKISDELKGSIKKIIQEIKQPEELIICPKKVQKIKIENLRPLERLMKKLMTLTTNVPSKLIQSALKKLISFYSEFQTKLFGLNADEYSSYLEPKIKMRLSGIGQTFYYLYKWVGQELLSDNDKSKKNVVGGSHIVRVINGNFYKISPDDAPYEYAVNNLAQLLTGKISTLSELLIVDIPDNKDIKSILVSKGVEGRNFGQLLQTEPELIEQIDSYNFSANFVLNLLVTLSDAKPENFMVQTSEDQAGNPKLRLVAIDNDNAFDLVIQNSNKGHFVKLKSILFCLPQMKNSIDSQFLKIFLRIKPELFIIDWLKSLNLKNAKYKAFSDILTSEEMKILHLPFRFPKGEINQVYDRFIKIQQLIKNNQNITHKQILKSIYPILDTYYDLILSNNQNKSFYLMEAIQELYEAPNLELFLKDYPEFIKELSDYKTTFQDWENKRTQSIESSIIELINEFDYSTFAIKKKKLTSIRKMEINNLNEITKITKVNNLKNDKQNQKLRVKNMVNKIVANFPFIEELVINNGSGVDNDTLEFIAKCLNNLKSIKLNKCKDISETGLCALLNYHPNCSIILEHFEKIDAYGLLIVAKHCRDLQFVLNNIAYPVTQNNVELLNISINKKWSNVLIFILIFGIHLSNSDKAERNALQISLENQNLMATEKLLHFGSNPNLINENGNSPLDLAFLIFEKENTRESMLIIALLISYGAVECKFAAKIFEIAFNMLPEFPIQICQNLKQNLFKFSLLHQLLNKHILLSLMPCDDTTTLSFFISPRIDFNPNNELFEALANNYTCLKSIYLSGCQNLNRVKLLEIVKIQNLQDIYLDYNQVHTCGIQIEDFKNVKFEKKDIHITSIIYSNQIGYLTFDELTKALVHNNYIESFEVINKKFTNDEINSLQTRLCSNQNLKSLLLTKNHLGEASAIIISFLQVHSTLTSLNIDRNHIGKQGLIAIANVLKQNNSLKRLSLVDNEFVDQDSISKFAESLKFNKTLTYLCLSDNDLSPQSGITIAKALVLNNCLEVIDLQKNSFDDRTAREFLDTLKFNKTLLKLKLIPTLISQPLIDSLQTAILKNQNFKTQNKLIELYRTSQNDLWFSYILPNVKPSNKENKNLKLENIHHRKCEISWDFLAESEHEISVSEGEIVNIIHKQDEWIYVEKSDQTKGFVPKSFVKILSD